MPFIGVNHNSSPHSVLSGGSKGDAVKKLQKRLIELNYLAEGEDDGIYLFHMFEYELANHEYCVTYDCEDAVNACGYTCDEVVNDPILNKALSNAVCSYMKKAEEMGWG